jgi:pimeloyl-ACP methyl ester carboxylesterase
VLAWLKRLFASEAALDVSVREETWRFDPSPERDAEQRDLWVAVHPAKSSRIVIMLPGWNGSLDGYARKYAKIAELLAERGVGAVVRSANPTVPGYPFETTCKTVLRGVVEGALARARPICGDPSPSLLLLGWSAGASAMAALAPDLPRVDRALLFAPSGDAGDEAIVSGLRRFTGDLFVVAGENDDVVGDLPRTLFDYATGTHSKQFVLLPDCGHQFKGEANGRIMSHAPLWAFAGEDGFPDPALGIHLYD